MTSRAGLSAVGDRVRLPLRFDVTRLRTDVDALDLREFVYYDVLPLTAPAHLVDPSRPPPPTDCDDYADGTWTEWLDTSALNEASYLRSVVETFRAHTRVTLVRLLRLEPGAVVQEHTDPTLGLDVPDSVVRLTVPIVSPEEVCFLLNGRPVPMQPGECWYLRLCDPHAITNGSAVVRINLTIDMEPNAWVRALLADAV